MKNKAFTLVELLVVITIIATLVGVFIGIFKVGSKHKERVDAEMTSKEEVGLGWTESLSRASFENHNYIVFRNGGAGVGIFHDPDCPCGKDYPIEK